MKILHITHCYHPSKGGVQWFFKNVSERLVKDYGDDVTVVTTDSMYGPERILYKKAGSLDETINGVKVRRFESIRWHIRPLRLLVKLIHKLKLTVPEKLTTILYGPQSPDMKRYLLNTQADVVCASSSNYSYMQLPLWKSCNFLYFGSIHLYDDPNIPVLTSVQRKSIEASKLYIANTEFEKQKLAGAGIDPQKIRVLGVGVDVELFNVEQTEINNYRSSLQIEKDAIVIAYVGRIERTKNVKLLIGSFISLSKTHTNIYLLIAGSGGAYADELKKFVGQLPGEVGERIRWKIDFEIKEKPLLFHTIDILVLPSSNESFGIVFLEAWVCKKPVIGTDIGAVRNVISENKDGLLMKSGDAISLNEKLHTLVCNQELRKNMGEAGYKKVMENFTWDIITAKIRSSYLENYNAN